MTDGNTYAINKHLDEREDYDALQEVTAALEQAEADNMLLIGRIEELEAENKTLRSMVADVIADTGDDPEIMAASRAEWAARALAAEAKLVKVVGALVVINALAPESMVNGYSQSDLTELVSRMGKVTRTTLSELKGQGDE
jgi:hypothetical protein